MRLDQFLISLHVAEPGDIGTAAVNEIAYPGYHRVTVLRTDAGWKIAGRLMGQDATQTVFSFPPCTADPGRDAAGTVPAARYAGLLDDDGGLLLIGKLYPPVHVGGGVTPQVILRDGIDGIATIVEDNQRQIMRRLPMAERLATKEHPAKPRAQEVDSNPIRVDLECETWE